MHLLVQFDEAPTFAHFGLLRNAIEAVEIALWTQCPSSRDKRVLRTLRLTLEGRRDIYSLQVVTKGAVGYAASLPSDDPV